MAPVLSLQPVCSSAKSRGGFVERIFVSIFVAMVMVLATLGAQASARQRHPSPMVPTGLVRTSVPQVPQQPPTGTASAATARVAIPWWTTTHVLARTLGSSGRTLACTAARRTVRARRHIRRQLLGFGMFAPTTARNSQSSPAGKAFRGERGRVGRSRTRSVHPFGGPSRVRHASAMRVASAFVTRPAPWSTGG